MCKKCLKCRCSPSKPLPSGWFLRRDELFSVGAWKTSKTFSSRNFQHKWQPECSYRFSHCGQQISISGTGLDVAPMGIICTIPNSAPGITGSCSRLPQEPSAGIWTMHVRVFLPFVHVWRRPDRSDLFKSWVSAGTTASVAACPCWCIAGGVSASVMTGYYGDAAVVRRFLGKFKTLAFVLDSSQTKCGQILQRGGNRVDLRAWNPTLLPSGVGTLGPLVWAFYSFPPLKSIRTLCLNAPQVGNQFLAIVGRWLWF